MVDGKQAAELQLRDFQEVKNLRRRSYGERNDEAIHVPGYPWRIPGPRPERGSEFGSLWTLGAFALFSSHAHLPGQPFFPFFRISHYYISFFPHSRSETLMD